MPYRSIAYTYRCYICLKIFEFKILAQETTSDIDIVIILDTCCKFALMLLVSRLMAEIEKGPSENGE